jgi:nucleotide-binding universal stress UspA family protein
MTTTEMECPRVVVGVDESDAALAAVRWAAQEARERHATLELVHVMTHSTVTATSIYAPLPLPTDPAFAAAAEWLAELVAALELGDLTVHHRIETGDPAHALARRAGNADLLVVGAHPRRGVLGLTQGSTADACIREAPCPVVVVPAPSHSGPPRRAR